MLSTVSVIFKHARFEWGLDVQNPVEQVKLPRPPRARQRRLREGEEERLFEALNQCKSPYIALAATIAIETGMRRSEMLGLRWSDLDLKRGVVHLGDTKNGRPRWVPLTQEALLAISRIRSLSDTTSDRIFPISASLLAQAWGHAIKRAGVEDLRWHDLRHEALSRWAHRLKGDVFKLSLVSGHRTLQMAQRYVHPVQAEILRIADMTV
jgi:integrase